jgi:hypothetical protein
VPEAEDNADRDNCCPYLATRRRRVLLDLRPEPDDERHEE